ncbi:hypothetical protein Agabi119p4_2802 [Agaricus bisporus var. burnettii]|uniref:Uncharacterized protein n=1 Tax=Agaricus bisporus var. burnettii TaxID=192524 RepID=A0A8H7F5W1_AGABI|nr:hypothetical protein AGABI2DRAFT_190212 [Agaricus bisporus var. bisporus H97]EKV49753.1 hypothetical protein AGABI2DRAFT_190212 [Agaricus bisporus var. bisporus H97]KAF7778457.1 hypothetical protein Agabi119p4_2802 [Agaricus bisporus var. burnettii]
MELPIVDRSHRAGSIHRQITTLTLFSNVTSLTAFAYCIPLGGKKTMIFTPCVSILTLLHHFILLLERRRCCILPPSFRHSISSTPSLIMFAWILGFTWLALSTVLASILGISIQHEAGRRELVFLAIEVGLSLLEAILLFALAMRCLRERELDCGAEKEFVVSQE